MGDIFLRLRFVGQITEHQLQSTKLVTQEGIPAVGSSSPKGILAIEAPLKGKVGLSLSRTKTRKFCQKLSWSLLVSLFFLSLWVLEISSSFGKFPSIFLSTLCNTLSLFLSLDLHHAASVPRSELPAERKR